MSWEASGVGVSHSLELGSTEALAPQLSLSALAAGSRVSQELKYTKEKLGEEAAYTSQMLIQTPRQEGENVLTPEALDLHLQAALLDSSSPLYLPSRSSSVCAGGGGAGSLPGLGPDGDVYTPREALPMGCCLLTGPEPGLFLGPTLGASGSGQRVEVGRAVLSVRAAFRAQAPFRPASWLQSRVP